jgi:Domain of unknown function (DUF5655)
MQSSRWTVEDHLLEKPAFVIDLCHRFATIVEDCGPITYSVTKTVITFKGTRRVFAGATLTGRSLNGFLDLQRIVKDSRIQWASPYTKRLFVNHFRVTKPGQLDPAFASWVREAYEVGAGLHLER